MRSFGRVKMAHQTHVRTGSASAVPRGVVIAALALMSWGLVLAAWTFVTNSFGFLLGA